jgi:hypothetical protein
MVGQRIRQRWKKRWQRWELRRWEPAPSAYALRLARCNLWRHRYDREFRAHHRHGGD